MNNTRILIPRRKRHNPNWLLRSARWVGKVRRLIINYVFYRKLNHTRQEAWNEAKNTI